MQPVAARDRILPSIEVASAPRERPDLGPMPSRQTVSNAMRASDLFVRCLENEGVERNFGVPGEENAHFMMSLEDYESLEETSYLLRVPANAQWLQASIQSLEAGEGAERKIVEIDEE